MVFFSLVLGTTFLMIGLLWLTCSFYNHLQPVPSSSLSDKDLPFVSILVPARNEELKIERCLQSLLAQNYPNFELIVIDDRSTDRTAEIIQSFVDRDRRVKLVHGKDAPSGWIGKCNALAHAVGYASGEWFIFTDADTYHHKNSVRDSVTYGLNSKADLASFVPLQELGSFWERLVMRFLLSSFLLGDPFHSVNDPEAERAYAYGQYIICRRSSYLAVGGHQSVRDEIVEDHAIARVFKEKGYRICVGDGKLLYSVRMYTDFESLWQGWTKNLYSIIDSRIGNLFAIIIAAYFTCVFPMVELAFVISRFILGEPFASFQVYFWIVLLQFSLLIAWFKRTEDHFSGCDWSDFFLIPFGSIAVSVLYCHAAYLVLSGSQVSWKGRRYTVNTSKTIQPMPNQPLDRALEEGSDI